MKQFGVIGNFGGNGIGGQITKTRELTRAIEQRYGEVNKLDVYGKKSNFIVLIRSLFEVLKSSQNVVVILASSGYFKLLPIICFINLKYKRNIYEFVIGGVRYKHLVGKKNRIRMENSVRKIYVETPYMVGEYEKLGLKNVECLPNFKAIDVMTIEQIKQTFRDGQMLHLCTFSRIDRFKGVDTAINIVECLNKKRDVYLDIIGPVDEEYKQDFLRMLKDADSSKIKYIGSVDSNKAVDTLKNYDVMLFPTRWEAEGFPGSFIDAMAAGVPIIASKLQNFNGIVIDDYNGYLIPILDLNQFVEKLTNLCDDKIKLFQMKKNALEKVEEYIQENVLKIFWKDIAK